MKKSCLGFTLIELLITVSIAAILFSLGIAQYNRFNRQQILDQAAQSLKNNLRLAQDKALAGEKPVATPPPSSSACNTLEGYQVEFYSEKYTAGIKCNSDVSDYLPPSEYVLPTGITITSFPSPNPILFKVLGQGTNVDAETTIILSGFGSERTIFVTSTGEIR